MPVPLTLKSAFSRLVCGWAKDEPKHTRGGYWSELGVFTGYRGRRQWTEEDRHRAEESPASCSLLWDIIKQTMSPS